jgi:hypothetical protein
MRETLCGVLRQMAPEKLPGHRLLLHRRSGEIGVETLQQSRAERRRWLPAPEAADLSFAKQVIAGNISSAPSPDSTTLTPRARTSLDSRKSGAGAVLSIGRSA